MSKDRKISLFVSSHSEHIVELDKKHDYEDQLAELEDLDEKHRFYAVGMIDVALIVYGEVFVRCDAFQPDDKLHAWVFKGTHFISYFPVVSALLLIRRRCWRPGRLAICWPRGPHPHQGRGEIAA
jgi:hypothetical protein